MTEGLAITTDQDDKQYLVHVENQDITPHPGPMGRSEYDTLMQFAQMAIRSGIIPAGIQTVEQAFAIMARGREVGISPFYALNQIVMIKGKPTSSSELLAHLIYRAHGDDALRMKEWTREKVVLHYKRRGWSEPDVFEFDMEDAKLAGLAGSDMWRKYPKAMLRARAMSTVAKAVFADAIGGLYVIDELASNDESWTVSDDGDVVPTGIAPVARETGQSNGSGSNLATEKQVNYLIGQIRYHFGAAYAKRGMKLPGKEDFEGLPRAVASKWLDAMKEHGPRAKLLPPWGPIGGSQVKAKPVEPVVEEAEFVEKNPEWDIPFEASDSTDATDATDTDYDEMAAFDRAAQEFLEKNPVSPDVQAEHEALNAEAQSSEQAWQERVEEAEKATEAEEAEVVRAAINNPVDPKTSSKPCSANQAATISKLWPLVHGDKPLEVDFHMSMEDASKMIQELSQAYSAQRKKGRA